MQTKLISEPKDLYTFLATPGIKVTNLAFPSDDVVWILWKHAAEEHVPNLRHTYVALALTSPQVPEFIYIAISTGWERDRSTAIQILSSTFSPATNII